MAELIPASIRVYIKYSFPLIVFRILPNIFGNTDGSLLDGRRLEDHRYVSLSTLSRQIKFTAEMEDKSMGKEEEEDGLMMAEEVLRVETSTAGINPATPLDALTAGLNSTTPYPAKLVLDLTTDEEDEAMMKVEEGIRTESWPQLLGVILQLLRLCCLMHTLRRPPLLLAMVLQLLLCSTAMLRQWLILHRTSWLPTEQLW